MPNHSHVEILYLTLLIEWPKDGQPAPFELLPLVGSTTLLPRMVKQYYQAALLIHGQREANHNSMWRLGYKGVGWESKQEVAGDDCRTREMAMSGNARYYREVAERARRLLHRAPNRASREVLTAIVRIFDPRPPDMELENLQNPGTPTSGAGCRDPGPAGFDLAEIPD